jgi:periplasmic protein TonB
MGSAQINPSGTNQEPELHLLLDRDSFQEPLWKSLTRQLDEFFFPKKLPPLQLESKPVPVKSIWGDYNYWKDGALGSTGMHVLLVGVIIAVTLIGHKVVTAAPKPAETTILLDPDALTPYKPSKTMMGGGGGGGDRDVLQASKGKLPKLSNQQLAPPVVVVRNEHPKLTVEPTLVVPQVQLANNNMPNLGDPTSHAVLPSNGTGAGGGIGSGAGGGVGPGKGPGYGPGEGGGYGGGVFHVGGGVSPPRPIYQPDPEFSEEARKAKYQGTVTLNLIVDANGHPRNIQVASSLGMGLDEKAIEAVKTWRFEPGQKDGHPVATIISVEVDFHLY